MPQIGNPLPPPEFDASVSQPAQPAILGGDPDHTSLAPALAQFEQDWDDLRDLLQKEEIAASATPVDFDPATQGCIVNQINSALAGSGLTVNTNDYSTQGGHAEFGLSPISSDLSLENSGFSPYITYFGNANGYRNSQLLNGIHINGSGYELTDIDFYDNLPVTTAQAHFDVGNANAGILGFLIHSVVDVAIGTLVGGTSLDPRCK